MFSDTETDMLGGEPPSASCVQGSDDSRNSAIRIAYRTLLRSSSLWEPRYPSLKIFLVYFFSYKNYYIIILLGMKYNKVHCKEALARILLLTKAQIVLLS